MTDRFHDLVIPGLDGNPVGGLLRQRFGLRIFLLTTTHTMSEVILDLHPRVDIHATGFPTRLSFRSPWLSDRKARQDGQVKLGMTWRQSQC